MYFETVDDLVGIKHILDSYEVIVTPADRGSSYPENSIRVSQQIPPTVELPVSLAQHPSPSHAFRSAH
jgi:hypothetical protein